MMHCLDDEGWLSCKQLLCEGVETEHLLLQPSSAATEWVFSLLSNSFKENQQNALEDYISTSVMLQYNSK